MVSTEARSNLKLFHLSAEEKKETSLNRCQIIDVSFLCLEPEWKLHSVVFRNFYTFSIALLYKSSLEYDWTVCIKERKLMPHSGSESGSQDVVILNKEHGCLAEKPCNLRIILRQPCTNWRDFGICNLKFIGATNSELDAISGMAAVVPLHSVSDTLHKSFTTSDYGEHYDVQYLSITE